MTAIREFSTMYASMFSLVLFLLLFESRLSRKKTTTLVLTLMVPLMLVNFVLLEVLGPAKMSTLLLITCSLPSLIFFWFLAKHRDGRFFFTFCFADTLILEVIDVTALLDHLLGNTYLFMLVSRLILCPLLAFALWKWVRPIYLEVQNSVKKGWYTFAVISLLFYVILSLAINVPTHINDRPEQKPIFVLLLILMPVIYIHIFSTLRHQKNAFQTAQHENILRLQVTNLRSRIEEFTSSDQQFRMERHNYRHNLQTIATLIENGQFDEARAVTQEYRDSIPESPLQRYCNYPVLDAVLASHLQQAKSQQIRITTTLRFPDKLPVREAELATVFANALENAIQACMAIDPERRSLEITVLEEPCFMFQIRNSYNGNVVFDENEIPVSRKKGHGFGTRSIVTFCDKNHAFYEFKADGEFFALRISFH